ncbi:hypothetical protein niasHT_011639 [Heterodera trifolii]|uniref:Innexin n=1 Tax=Heterodera trifolii TaxID=157864 RepID=A0ABD2LGZ5_9BILA
MPVLFDSESSDEEGIDPFDAAVKCMMQNAKNLSAKEFIQIDQGLADKSARQQNSGENSPKRHSTNGTDNTSPTPQFEHSMLSDDEFEHVKMAEMEQIHRRNSENGDGLADKSARQQNSGENSPKRHSTNGTDNTSPTLDNGHKMDMANPDTLADRMKVLQSPAKCAYEHFLIEEKDEKELVPANRAILSASSDVFEAMFQKEATENANGTIGGEKKLGTAAARLINVQQLPFFGDEQLFYGKTLWDWIKKPRARFTDSIDRLNCHFVPLVLLFFVAMISANIIGFGGMEPMRCLRSPELNEEEREFALDYCTSKNQYYVAPEEGIPWANPERRARQLGYYHWVPILLLLQAMLFYLPNWLWNHLNQQSGIEFTKFIEEATKLKGMLLAPIKERQEQVSQLREKLSEAVLDRDPYRRIVGCRFGESMGAYVSLLYVCIKLLYLGNVASQFYLLNSFIGGDYQFWGLEVLKSLLNGQNWQDSAIFPRISLCDIQIRRLGDTPRYTLQCHLRINTYNEKIYLFIWWGFGLVAILTTINFVYYLFVLLLFPWTQERSVRHLLKQDKYREIVYSNNRRECRLIRRFAEHALRKDGILLFWFIEGHAGPIVARELMGELFEIYKTDMHEEDDEQPSEVSVVNEKVKGSFLAQNTGSLGDDTYGGIAQRFGNGISPSAPHSKEKQKLLPNGNNNDINPHHYHQQHNQNIGGRNNGRYPAHADRPREKTTGDSRRRNAADIGTGGVSGGDGGGFLSSVFSRLGTAVLGHSSSSPSHRSHPYASASFYGRTPIKQV